MRFRFAHGFVLGCVAAALSGCGFFGGEEREPWRGKVEAACLAAKLVTPTDFTRPIDEIDGPGVCGLEHPFRIYAVADGSVGVQPAARLGCPMTAVLNDWMVRTVQPAAKARFGVAVVEIKNAASFGCRTRNNKRGAKLSEHGFGNALDISAFILADGREISIARDWRRGAPEAQAFLREAHAGACGAFKTVLGPGSDEHHENHLHLDLARHDPEGRRAYCRPTPVMPELPPEPQLAPEGDEPAVSYAPEAKGFDGPTGSIGRRFGAEVSEPPADWQTDE
ncbi:extensin-like domain-containing protein [Methylopila sp. Yamaguchi]|uniref:extensin-like domain-containing protein n=1 Tax=Methylopila sp. Yamaguchi TaxID=1437817 RepID=UPI000CB8EC22|nr:extensin family protein [Methylopila sp. Yamaguchi]GBD49078.1 extensin family protein [Methylopila sp. Yamaguchi]